MDKQIIIALYKCICSNIINRQQRTYLSCNLIRILYKFIEPFLLYPLVLSALVSDVCVILHNSTNIINYQLN